MTALERQSLQLFFFLKEKPKKRKKKIKKLNSFSYQHVAAPTRSRGMLLLQVSLLIILEAGKQGRGEIEKKKQGG